MSRTFSVAYGAVCYAIFFGTFLYLVGFLGNFGVPKSIDSGVPGPLAVALLVDGALLALFGIQHSGMARQGFKAWWTRIVPQPIERSTYVLVSSLVLILLYWAWRPIPEAVVRVEGSVARTLLTGLYLGGYGIVLLSTFLIDHFDLFGLRQVALHFQGRRYEEKRFATPWLYRLVRHPLYVGWLIAFWLTPDLTVGRVLFAAGMTAYILGAIPLEERDLAGTLGEPYLRWRERTPRFVPRFGPQPSRAGEREPQAG
ncbi:MAG TPA: isoprenylcysteine carboxylmethyltransferase family protein [Myxococcota bacterium]|jgi:protein-S-isoprenylcysteine O-methyltransferase Ste14|nr:isoprenylcysteine carboxylmethyltransferase family protein [Myxococcota bacterium]